MAKARGRPRNAEPSEILTVTVEPKLIEYLEILRKKQGFGGSHSAIAREFIWKEVNRLIEARRLEEK
jgi:hypothetical protein